MKQVAKGCECQFAHTLKSAFLQLLKSIAKRSFHSSDIKYSCMDRDGWIDGGRKIEIDRQKKGRKENRQNRYRIDG